LKYGTVFFAGGGRNSRRTDLCIAFCGKNGGTCRPGLGSAQWETPIGEVQLEGESGATLKKIEEGGYGDMPPWGKGPSPGRISSDRTRTIKNPLGTYLKKDFEKIDYFIGCTIDGQ
jgi:hypothetical protein